MVRRIAIVCAALLSCALVATGCGSDESKPKASKQPSNTAATPAPLTAGGQFVICTDVPYPPAEYLEGANFVGYEIEIMNDVARRLNTTPAYAKTLFDAIIPALQSKKCDAIISSMNVTPQREQQVSFVEYLEIGQSLMVATGTDDSINTLDDLSGLSVAVQVGTTLKDALDKKSAELVATGVPKIKVQTFPDAGAAAAALATGKVDVFFADSPVVADYVNKQPDQFDFAGEPIDPLPVGIATRKEDVALHDAITDAIQAMYKDGAMKTILQKWKISDFALDVVRDHAGNTITVDPQDLSVKVAQGGASDQHGETADDIAPAGGAAGTGTPAPATGGSAPVPSTTG